MPRTRMETILLFIFKALRSEELNSIHVSLIHNLLRLAIDAVGENEWEFHPNELQNRNGRYLRVDVLFKAFLQSGIFFTNAGDTFPVEDLYFGKNIDARLEAEIEKHNLGAVETAMLGEAAKEVSDAYVIGLKPHTAS